MWNRLHFLLNGLCKMVSYNLGSYYRLPIWQGCWCVYCTQIRAFGSDVVWRDYFENWRRPAAFFPYTSSAFLLESRLLKGWKPFIISTAFLLFCFSFSLPAAFYCVMKLYTSGYIYILSSLFSLYYSNIAINNGCGVGVVCWCSICMGLVGYSTRVHTTHLITCYWIVAKLQQCVAHSD